MYLDFYGLAKEPFRLNPDPRFLHLAEPHRTALEAMLDAVSERKGLQVAVGPIGTGKTTLLYCLQHILMHEATPERPMRTAFIVNPVLTALELFEAIFDELEVTASAASKPASLRRLHEILAEGYARKGTLLLIIDEAHLLSAELIEEVRLLLNLDSYPSPVLQVLLCGQPELVSVLSRPEFASFKQRVSVFSKLRALTQQETRAYIAERLHIAGLRGESPFSSTALEYIHVCTNGVPRLINRVCDRALMAGCRRQIKKLGAEFIRDGASDVELTDAPLSFPETAPSSEPVLTTAQNSQSGRP